MSQENSGDDGLGALHSFGVIMGDMRGAIRLNRAPLPMN